MKSLPLWIVTALFFGTAIISSGIVKDIALSLFGTCSGLLATTFIPKPGKKSRSLLVAFASLATGAAVFFGYHFITDRSPVAFHRTDGLVADFTSGIGGPPRTASGTQISILSDGAWNSRSTLRYERMDGDLDQPPNGFFRIFFDLKSAHGGTPYSGVYFDFSLPPSKTFDLSPFTRLSARFRKQKVVMGRPVRVAIVLYSSNVKNEHYAFPTYYVPDTALSENWTTIKAAFRDFGKPESVDYPVSLDLRKVYRMAIVVLGHPNFASQGHLDVDDIKFD